MIQTEALTRRFGPVTAVDAVTFQIADGEVFGLLGPNGAGKTTTLRMLAGLIGVTEGRAVVDGLDVRDPAQAAQVRARLGLLPEEPGLYPDLTVRETLDFFARLQHVPDRRRRVDDLLDRLALGERASSRVATLSKGWKQRLALARALVNEPRIVFLDEPTANLDPEASQEVRAIIRDLRDRGCTVVLNTHRLEEVERTCDRVGILRTRLLAIAEPRALRRAATDAPATIGLEHVDADLVHAVAQRLGVQPDVTEDGLVIPCTPSRPMADVVAAVVAAGGRITRAVVAESSLEDAYLEVLRDADR